MLRCIGISSNTMCKRHLGVFAKGTTPPHINITKSKVKDTPYTPQITLAMHYLSLWLRAKSMGPGRSGSRPRRSRCRAPSTTRRAASGRFARRFGKPQGTEVLKKWVAHGWPLRQPSRAHSEPKACDATILACISKCLGCNSSGAS